MLFFHDDIYKPELQGSGGFTVSSVLCICTFEHYISLVVSFIVVVVEEYKMRNDNSLV